MRKALLVIGSIGGLLSSLALIGLLVAPRVLAVGSASIPNVIAAQPAGNLQAALLDDNWNALRDYVNERELSSDVLSARPAAGTAGRFFFATDDNGGTLYFDNGSSWTTLSPGVNSAGAGSYAVRGLRWATATATNTSFNGTADLVTLRNPSTGTLITQKATSTITNNTIAASPAANARDSSTAFTANSWVHFYYIWNGSAVASLSSTCAPSDVTGSCPTVGGPVLPTGYTHWAYIGPVRYMNDATLHNTQIAGARAIMVATRTALNLGASTTFNNVPLSTLVTSNAVGVILHGHLRSTTAASDLNNVTADISVGTPSIANYLAIRSNTGNGGGSAQTFTVPNVSQAVQYRVSSSTNGMALDLFVSGFTIPNGGD